MFVRDYDRERKNWIIDDPHSVNNYETNDRVCKNCNKRVNFIPKINKLTVS